MASHFNENIDFVLGYGGYLKLKGLLNKYIRYDSFTIGLQYLGMAIRGVPYMGVGVIWHTAGHSSLKEKDLDPYTCSSGDDDLFVNSNAKKTNTCVEFRKETHTRSVPCSTLKDWIKQKKRHLTTAPYYKLRDKLRLISEPVSRVLFYISLIILVSLHFQWQIIMIVFGLRFISQIIVLALGQKRLNEPGLTLYSVIFDIFSPFINGIVFS